MSNAYYVWCSGTGQTEESSKLVSAIDSAHAAEQWPPWDYSSDAEPYTISVRKVGSAKVKTFYLSSVTQRHFIASRTDA